MFYQGETGTRQRSPRLAMLTLILRGPGVVEGLHLGSSRAAGEMPVTACVESELMGKKLEQGTLAIAECQGDGGSS